MADRRRLTGAAIHGPADLTDEELAQLDAVIERSWQDAKAGRVVAADDLLAELRARR